MIFVCVGSRNYPFNRLFLELDRLYDEGLIKDEIFAQIGTSTYEPRNFQFTDYLSQDLFQDKIEEADIVISHGASGSIMKALNANKIVIAVTRLEKYGEHINDHQIQTNEAFARNNYVFPVFEMEELGTAIKTISEEKIKLSPWKNVDPDAIVKLIDSFIKINF